MPFLCYNLDTLHATKLSEVNAASGETTRGATAVWVPRKQKKAVEVVYFAVPSTHHFVSEYLRTVEVETDYKNIR